MTQPRTSALPRVFHPGGLSNRDTRTRMECLRISADAGGAPNQVIARAEDMVGYIDAAANEDERSHRWVCLRMASQMGRPPEHGDDFVAMAKAFEAFVYQCPGPVRA